MTHLVGGVDEAGRGPLAGSVVAACVILGADHNIAGITDSKRLSEKKRNHLAERIKAHARAWAVASASAGEIDRLNILRATLLAMKRAIEQMPITPDIVLIDGNHGPEINIPMKMVIKGDSLITEIAAASILAKTTRDAEMLDLHQRFPQYGFDQHKGYPTKAHLAALKLYGITEMHRQSFTPVKIINEFNH